MFGFIAIIRALLAPREVAVTHLPADVPIARGERKEYTHATVESFVVSEDRVQEAKAIIRQEGGFILQSGPVADGYQLTVAY